MSFSPINSFSLFSIPPVDSLPEEGMLTEFVGESNSDFLELFNAQDTLIPVLQTESPSVNSLSRKEKLQTDVIEILDDEPEKTKKRKRNDQVSERPTKRIWNPSEDQKLVKAIKEYRGNLNSKWKNVANEVFGKAHSYEQEKLNAKICKIRHIEIDDYDTEFSVDEKKFILSQILDLEGYGNWKYISFKLTEFKKLNYIDYDMYALRTKIKKIWERNLINKVRNSPESWPNFPIQKSPFQFDLPKYFFTENETDFIIAKVEEIIDYHKIDVTELQESYWINIYNCLNKEIKSARQHDANSIKEIYMNILSKRKLLQTFSQDDSEVTIENSLVYPNLLNVQTNSGSEPFFESQSLEQLILETTDPFVNGEALTFEPFETNQTPISTNEYLDQSEKTQTIKSATKEISNSRYRWLPSADARLIEAIKKQANWPTLNWSEIAIEVFGKAKYEKETQKIINSCKNRWKKQLLDFDVYFTKNEKDFILSQIKELDGSGNWKYLAFKLIEYRKQTYSNKNTLHKRISQLWDQSLKNLILEQPENWSNFPTVQSPYDFNDKKYYFTEEENEVIISNQSQGKSWIEISKILNQKFPNGMRHDAASIEIMYRKILYKRNSEAISRNIADPQNLRNTSTNQNETNLGINQENQFENLNSTELNDYHTESGDDFLFQWIDLQPQMENTNDEIPQYIPQFVPLSNLDSTLQAQFPVQQAPLHNLNLPLSSNMGNSLNRSNQINFNLQSQLITQLSSQQINPSVPPTYPYDQSQFPVQYAPLQSSRLYDRDLEPEIEERRSQLANQLLIETQRARSNFALANQQILQAAIAKTRSALSNQLQVEELIAQRNFQMAERILAEAAISQARGAVINQMLNELPLPNIQLELGNFDREGNTFHNEQHAVSNSMLPQVNSIPEAEFNQEPVLYTTSNSIFKEMESGRITKMAPIQHLRGKELAVFNRLNSRSSCSE